MLPHVGLRCPGGRCRGWGCILAIAAHSDAVLLRQWLVLKLMLEGNG